MNPILAAAAFGFVKGLVLKGRSPDRVTAMHGMSSRFAGALHEEVQSRWVPFQRTGGQMPIGGSALPFAMGHYAPGAPNGLNALRVADAVAGGLLYESAFRSFGLLGAIAAHAIHNIAHDAAQGRYGGGHR